MDLRRGCRRVIKHSYVRVLMINYEYPPIGGGSGNATAHLLDVFKKMGVVTVDLITAGIGDRLEWETPRSGVRIARLPVRKQDLHYWRAQEIAAWAVGVPALARRMVEAGSYDLCHCWSGWPSGVIGYRWRQHVPYLIALRGSDVPGYSARLRLLDALVFRRLCRRIWRAAAEVTSVSQTLLTLARRTLPELEATVIPNGIDTDRFFPATEEVSPFTLLFVGRLIERKGLSPLVGGFAELVRRRPGCRLVVVGGGPDRSKLESQIRHLGIGRSVRLTGSLPHDELPAMYRSASVFVSPSIRDAMSNAMLEAMASGLPMVATKTGATELFGDNAILIDRPDPEAICRAALRYRDDPELRARHARNARRIAEGMAWERVAERYLGVYHKIVKEAGPVAA